MWARLLGSNIKLLYIQGELIKREKCRSNGISNCRYKYLILNLMISIYVSSTLLRQEHLCRTAALGLVQWLGNTNRPTQASHQY